jgi:hypothetical protein
MTLPRPHSCTWSDDDHARGLPGAAQATAPKGPEALEGKELYFWVTYPDAKKRKKRKGKKAGSRAKDLKLWAVMILEDLRPIDDFTYAVTLTRVFKEGERAIKVWVKNDPCDPADEAEVFGFVSPHPKRLAPLEQHLAQVAAKRVYDAIAETWSESQAKTPLETT